MNLSQVDAQQGMEQASMFMADLDFHRRENLRLISRR